MALELRVREADLGHQPIDRELAVRPLAQETVGGCQDLPPRVLVLLAIAGALLCRTHAGMIVGPLHAL